MINKAAKTFFWYYFPAVLWMGIIFYLSSVSGLRSGASIPIEIVLRKVAHMAEFALLAILFWRIFAGHWKMSFANAGNFATLFALIYAISDEVHQSFVADRAGRGIDVLVDLAGILLGVLLAKNFSYFKDKLFSGKK